MESLGMPVQICPAYKLPSTAVASQESSAGFFGPTPFQLCSNSYELWGTPSIGIINFGFTEGELMTFLVKPPTTKCQVLKWLYFQNSFNTGGLPG